MGFNLAFKGLMKSRPFSVYTGSIPQSYNESRRDAIFLKFILVKYATCFGQVHCPSSGVSQHCTHAIGICHASSVGVC
jgi:hypothetical protein